MDTEFARFVIVRDTFREYMQSCSEFWKAFQRRTIAIKFSERQRQVLQTHLRLQTLWLERQRLRFEYLLRGGTFETGFWGELDNLLAWQLLRLRVRQVEKRLRLRQEEREAIARELHDTLLQSTQGLIYTFQGLAEEIDRDSPLRAQMEGSLDRADDLLKEARDRVTRLRKAGNEFDVEAMIRRASVELFSDTPTQFSVVRTGIPKPLRPASSPDIAN
jgi:signal transduction histidine kinase